MPVWPCSRYSGPPNANPRSTGPFAGQVQASAADGQTNASASSSAGQAVVFLVNMDSRT
jgi:hypothetical protein